MYLYKLIFIAYASNILLYMWMKHHLFGHSPVAGDINADLLIMVYNYILVMLFT